jgi:hypothetical protein
MTDREFAKEAFEFIKAMVNTEEHYTLSERGKQHFDSMIELVSDRRENKVKDHIMNNICKIEPMIEKIKSIANGGHLIDGELRSSIEVLALSMKRLLDKIDADIDIDKETEDTVEFESADDLVSKLFDGGNK